MALIEWKPSMSVGVAEMDRQHQKLIELTNRVYEAMLRGKGNEVLGQVVRELVAYTRSHFAAEEALMTQWGYPSLAQHRSKHEELVVQVDKLATELEEKRLGMSVRVVQFLRNWLVDHIQGTDKGYTGFLARKAG
jgi:hemerythrin